jgi:transglutaminase-like putative cysteine protease
VAVTPARILSQAALVSAAMAATTTLYGSFFAGGGYLPRLIMVAIAASATAAVAVTLRLRGPGTVIVAAAGFAVTAVFTVLSGTPYNGLSNTLRIGWQALTGGWAAMLSIAAPAPDSAQMLMTPALITWVAGFLAVTVALRTRSVLGPAAIVVCAQGAGLMFAANQPVTHLIQTCALLVLLLILTLTRAGGSTPRYRTRAALIAVIAGAGLLGALAAPVIGAAQRFNPRDLLIPPVRPQEALNPLSEVRAQLRISPPRKLFTITISGANDPGDLIQTVALNSFDGSEWTSSDSFLVAGPVLAPDQAASGATTLTERVTLSMPDPYLPGPYLPVIGRPVQIDASLGSAALIGFDPDSGTLVAESGVRGGSYTVIAKGEPDSADLADAAVGSGESVAPYTELPTVPAALAALAAKITAVARTPYAKLVAIEDYLRKLPASRNAPAGDSYGNLLRLLTANTPQGEAGYADQHASAFAVLARAEGLPTRVVVGYRLPAYGVGRDGRYTVTTADAYAWAQAYFRGYGWIDFDPTDTGNTVALPPVISVPVQPRTRPLTKPVPSHAATAPVTRPSPHPVRTLVIQARAGRGTSHVPFWILIPALPLLCALVAGPTAGRRLLRRRRRRGSTGTSMRVIGAWEEVVDRLVDAGVRIDGSQTAKELALRARQPAAARPTREQHALAQTAPHLCELASLATEAAFGGDPSSAEDVHRAWLLEGRVSKALYRGWRAPYRVAHWIVPAPRRTRDGRPRETKEA